MFDKIFYIVQEVNNSQGIKILERLIQSLSFLVNILNSDEIKHRKNEIIDDLIKVLESHKDKENKDGQS